jgi:hypothetical protein
LLTSVVTLSAAAPDNVRMNSLRFAIEPLLGKFLRQVLQELKATYLIAFAQPNCPL